MQLGENILKLMEIAKEKGYTVEDLAETAEEREERKRQEEAEIQTALVKGNNDKYWTKFSLWPNGIPQKKFTFMNWVPGKQQDEEAAGKIARKALELTKRLVNEEFNVTLAGFPGVGKTALALAMGEYLRSVGKSVMMVSTAELKYLYSRSFNAEDIEERLRFTLAKMKEVDVLILDDFGTEGDLNAQGNVRVRSDMRDDMYRLSNARINKTTIITTNNRIDELATMYDPKVADRMIPKDKNYRIVFAGMKSVRRTG